MPSWIWQFVYANYGGMSSLMLRVGCILVRSTSDWTCLVGHTHTVGVVGQFRGAWVSSGALLLCSRPLSFLLFHCNSVRG